MNDDVDVDDHLLQSMCVSLNIHEWLIKIFRHLSVVVIIDLIDEVALLHDPKHIFVFKVGFFELINLTLIIITNCHLYSSLFRVRLFHSIVSSIFHLSLQLPLMCVPNLSASKFILHTKDMLK